MKIIPYSERGALLILQHRQRKGYGDIAPLPGWSLETLEEAMQPLNQTPAFRWAISSAMMHFDNIVPQNPQLPLLKKTKIKVGHLSVEEAVRCVLQKKRPRVDVNRQWNLEQALHFCKKVPADRIEFLEEPVATFEELLELKKSVTHRIAVDEHLRELPLETIIDLAPDFAIIKPPLTGSVEEILQIAKHLPVRLSSSFESPIGHFNLALLRGKIDAS